jgi:hypothetical protein
LLACLCWSLTALYGASTVASNRVEEERGMSRIDRRAFVMGCLAVPLAGCPDPNSFIPGGSTGLLPAQFQNHGYPRTTGDTPVFVVTGGIKP